ncbi:hypothetical protein FQN57_005141 [Myotisia sp. PD_48]|nr:hypothetical protein FQN57_005141 [Myotisia sp. PD_48]
MDSLRHLTKVGASTSHTDLPGLSDEQVLKTDMLQYQLGLLRIAYPTQEAEEASLAPIFTGAVLANRESAHPNDGATLNVSQYGLLAGSSEMLKSLESKQDVDIKVLQEDPRLLFNVTAPSSTFICGSQGSGKSHTLSCMLENCLIPSKAGHLPNPLTGVVFHYDAFISDTAGSPCEAAFLSSHADAKVRVLCSPTNIRSMKGTYSRFDIDVEPLQIDQNDLNTKRMMDLMAVGQNDGSIPLYMQSVKRILREMRILQQQAGTRFDYKDFKQRIMDIGLTPMQLEPLKQRLDILESFMPQTQTTINRRKGKNERQYSGSDWNPIYMNSSLEASAFTDTLLSTVRLQRHLGVRVIISTQEPTISTALLNLCSITIVHRFTSPEWLRALRKHLAAAAEDLTFAKPRQVLPQPGEDCPGEDSPSLMDRIVCLTVGEALLFAPSAIIYAGMQGNKRVGFRRLGADYLTIKVRERLTADGGKSILS